MKISHTTRSRLSVLLFVFFGIVSNCLFAQRVNIIPRPDSVLLRDGVFRLTSGSAIGVNDTSLMPLVLQFRQELKTTNGLVLTADSGQNAAVDLRLLPDNEIIGAYALDITTQKITITASNKAGVFYGLTSLLQLLATAPVNANQVDVPAMLVKDKPRYQWRGFMLDESRHFFGKQEVKQLLDWMAFYKLNKFHWHLTDAQGWRIEIKQYPRLTTIGGTGNYTDTLAPARYYTQEEIREVVAYAKERFIDVIPEIDMPGHATAANRAYPQFSGGAQSKYPDFTFDPANEGTYGFLANILKEVNGLFPDQMIHLGGDEVALGMQAWAGRPAIMEMMKRNSLHALSDLEHYFFRRMADTVYKLGSKTLCWDEATESGLPVGKTIIFWWRQNVPESLQIALSNHYQVVLCPRLPLYFDFVQDRMHVAGRKWNGLFNSVSSVYNFPEHQLAPAAYNSQQILGIQANLWTETVGSEKRLDYMVFPRMAALAEAAWTDSAAKKEVEFNEHLKAHLALYDNAGIYYYDPFDPAFHPEAIDFKPDHVMPGLRRKRRHKESGRRHQARHLTKRPSADRRKKNRHKH